MRQFSAADPARRAAGNDGLGLRLGQRCGEQEAGCCCTTRRRSPSRPGRTRPVRVKWINDLRATDIQRQLSCRTCCPSTRRCTGPTRPAGPPAATRGRRSRSTPGRYTGPGADRHPRARRRRRRRRERRLRRGLVPAGRRATSRRATPRGDLVRLLHGQGGRQATAPRGVPASRRSSTPTHNRASTIWYHDHALGMTRLNVYAGPAGFYIVRGGPAGDERRARLALRHCGRASRPGAQGGRQVPAQQDLLRDPDRHPGPRVQRRRLAVLPGHARVLRRRLRPTRLHPGHRPLADLEPRVLRQHDHGERQHLAVPDRASSAATGSASSTAASRAS